jgi:alanine racemase
MLNKFVAWAEIDLDAIAHNVTTIKRHVGDGVRVIAVVKANAYGHGVVPVAQTALQSGASWLAVGRVGEGIALRRAGIRAPILMMCYTPAANAAQIAAYDLTPTVTSMPLAQALSAQGRRQGKPIPIHVKVDTGMGRFGLLPDDVLDFVRALNRLSGLRLEGIFSHFATADQIDQTYFQRQLAAFKQVLAALEAEDIHIPVRHAVNSAGTLYLPEAHLDAVRPGIAIYGLRPSLEMEPPFSLRPALALKSRVGRVQTLPENSSISYGPTFTTQRPTPVVLIPIGYGDGYFRLNSNRGVVLIHGKRAPIRGQVCMDQLVAEVSGIEDVQLNDEVVLIGRQGDEVLSAEEVASWGETINHEVVTHLLQRVPRVYLRGGQIEMIDNGIQRA